MKTTTSIFLLLLASCLLSVPGTWAQTEGYSSYGQNALTGIGVVGAEYLGSKDISSGLYGHASSTSGYVYGGYFRSDAAMAMGVRHRYGGTGATCGGLFYNDSVNGVGVKGCPGRHRV